MTESNTEQATAFGQPLSIDQILDQIRLEAKSIEVADKAPAATAKMDLNELIDRLAAASLNRPADKSCFHKYEFYQYNDIEFVQNAYRAILGREADEAGLDGYVKALRESGDKDRVLKALLQSEEGRRKGTVIYGLDAFYGPQEFEKEVTLPLSGTLSKFHFLMYEGEEFVRAAYWGVLKRQPDESGMRSTLKNLQDGVSKEEILLNLRRSEEGRKAGVNLSDMFIDRVFYLVDRIPVVGKHLRRLTNPCKRMLPGAKFQTFMKVCYTYGPLVRLQNHQDYWLKRVTAEQYQKQQQVEVLTEALLKKHQALLDDIEHNQQLTAELKAIKASLERVRQDQLYRETRLNSLLESTEKAITSDSPISTAPDSAPASRYQPELEAYYVAFEDECRGETAEIRQKQAKYLDVLRDVPISDEAPVLDIGCGRGEWLGLLKDSNLPARGVDTNGVMAEFCRSNGLNAEQGDALQVLQQLPDASLAAVTGFHIIEHLPFDVLYGIFLEASRCLKPGGVIIFETPNPENVLVGSHTFYHDFTHRNPVTPSSVSFLARYCGFSDIELIRSSPYPQEARIKGEDPLTERFNNHLYGDQDYAIVARKGESA